MNQCQLRFSIREVFLGMLSIGVALAWWSDHAALNGEIVKLGMSAESNETRVTAVRELRDYLSDRDAIPVLIYALSDPDPQIAVTAEQSLRQLSGIRDGFGSVENATPDERLSIMRHWIDWHLARR